MAGKPPVKFSYLRGFDEIRTAPDKDFRADLAVALDVSDRGRMGDLVPVFDGAKDTLNIDHHVTNPGFAADTVCLPDSSSACEVLFGLLERDRISRETAACLYTGIVTDTGVFKYNATSEATMQTAGFLMTTGIPFGEIIDRAFYRKTWPQNRILGKALSQAEKGSLRSPVLGHGRYCRAAAADRGSGVFLPCLGTYSRTVEAVASLCGSGGCFFHLCQVRRRRPHPGRRLHHHRKTPGRIHAGNPPSGGRTDQSMKRSREC